MRRRRCPAARVITAELEADKALDRFNRTRSQRSKVALQQARTDAMRAWQRAR